MKKCLYLTLLLSGSPLFAQTSSDVFEEFDTIMKKMHEDFEERFKAIEKYVAVQFPQAQPSQEQEKTKPSTDKKQTQTQQTIEVLPVKDNDQYVVVKFNLGELEKDKINVEAFDKSLKGSAVLKKDGSSVNFYVEGYAVGVSTRREVKENKKDDKKTYDNWQFSEAVKEQSIPAVSDLTKTEVSYENNIIQLKLPRVSQIKGTKLNVK